MKLYFDGLCQPNPGGLACFGYVAYEGSSKIAEGFGEAWRGKGSTNNVAEYTALIKGLRHLLVLGYRGVTLNCLGDSQLVVNQMSGEWGVYSPRLKPLYEEAKDLAAYFDATFDWVPHDLNKAHPLARKAYAEAL